MVSFSSLIVASAMATAALAAPFAAPVEDKKLAKRTTNAKKGAAYNDASYVSLVTDVSWAYNWADAVGGTLPSGVEYVPMLWGSGSTDGWDDAVATALAAGSTAILGFNEPDDSDQANLDAETAASLYKEYITPYKDQAELVSPAVTNGAAPMGLTWLEEYLGYCAGECGQTAIAIHYYADVVDTTFEAYVEEAYAVAEKYGIYKVWITEFQKTDVTDAAEATFIENTLPWLDDQSYVERYAYFYVAENYLLGPLGEALSTVGEAYNDTN